MKDSKNCNSSKNCNCSESCKCSSVLGVVSLAVSVVILVGGVFLGTTLYKKIDTIHKATVQIPFVDSEVVDTYLTTIPMDKQKEDLLSKLGQLKVQVDTEANNSKEDTQVEKNLTADEIESFISGTPILDGKDSDILVMEYADFLCGHCKRLHEDATLETLSKENEDVSVLAHFIPLFGEQSEAGAKGAYCSAQLGGQEFYYKFINEGFSTQATTANEVLAIAEKLGLDKDKFESCLSDTATNLAVNKIFPLASAKFGVNGTPATIVINRKTGRYEIVGGAAPKSHFEDAIQKVRETK